MRNIVFLHNKFPKNEKAFVDLIERWGKYQLHFKNYSGGNTFSILTLNNLSHKQQLALENQSISVICSHATNPLHRMFQARKIIKSSSNKATLVCGDNQTSLFVAIYMKCCLFRKVHIQTQFHGDTYTLSSNKGVQGVVRVLLSFVAIRISNSIRVVSAFQVQEIQKLCGKHNVKFVVAPIPIDFKRIPESSNVRDIDLLFVGRFHKERGINELVSILNAVMAINPELSITLVGEGPLKKYAFEHLTKTESISAINFPGYLDYEQLRDVYSRSKILLSTAPKEGYGLTLREAALSSMKVIARTSKGSLDASVDFPEQISTYNSLEEAVQLINSTISGKFMDINPAAKYKQMNNDLSKLKELFNSWEHF